MSYVKNLRTYSWPLKPYVTSIFWSLQLTNFTIYGEPTHGITNFLEIKDHWVCKNELTLSWRRPLSYKNQSIELLRKSMDWFLYDNGLRHERVKQAQILFKKLQNINYDFFHVNITKQFWMLLGWI